MKWWKLMKLETTFRHAGHINKWDLSDQASIAVSFISEESVKVHMRRSETSADCEPQNVCVYRLDLILWLLVLFLGFKFLYSDKYCAHKARCTIRVNRRMWAGLSISCFTDIQSKLSEIRAWGSKLESRNNFELTFTVLIIITCDYDLALNTIL